MALLRARRALTPEADPVGGRPRRVRRAAVLAAGAAATVLALSGCMRLDLAVTLSDDDTVDGSFVLAIDKTLLEMSGVDPEEAFDEATSGSLPDVGDLGGAEVTTEPYDQDGMYGQRIVFTGASLDAFAGGAEGDDGLSITREGDYYVVAGSMDLSDATSELGTGAEGDAVAEKLLESLQVRFAVTFPGEVVEHNGELDGTTVTWSPKVGEKLVMSARGLASAGAAVGSSGGGGGSATGSSTGGSSSAVDVATTPASVVTTLLPWAVAALVLLGLAAILVVVLRRGARNGAVSPVDRPVDDDPFLLGGPGAPAASDLGRPDLASPPHDTVVLQDEVPTTTVDAPPTDRLAPPS